jgi:hypothetical protein
MPEQLTSRVCMHADPANAFWLQTSSNRGCARALKQDSIFFALRQAENTAIAAAALTDTSRNTGKTPRRKVCKMVPGGATSRSLAKFQRSFISHMYSPESGSTYPISVCRQTSTFMLQLQPSHFESHDDRSRWYDKQGVHLN